MLRSTSVSVTFDLSHTPICDLTGGVNIFGDTMHSSDNDHIEVSLAGESMLSKRMMSRLTCGERRWRKLSGCCGASYDPNDGCLVASRMEICVSISLLQKKASKFFLRILREKPKLYPFRLLTVCFTENEHTIFISIGMNELEVVGSSGNNPRDYPDIIQTTIAISAKEKQVLAKLISVQSYFDFFYKKTDEKLMEIDDAEIEMDLLRKDQSVQDSSNNVPDWRKLPFLASYEKEDKRL
ncbi:galactose-binding domain-like, Armadillo-type fold protein [Artemisia annua]|uniref:Galactose-binding domain-like, Armadillo-type fold protein n=1 Tax=Artemisia annua TaxID=35608 RepID=A0A2U1MEE4_ARTAN|nr:galactose-binding domain-like, Armadillo-type fold protein [Artemisia annua]